MKERKYTKVLIVAFAAVAVIAVLLFGLYTAASYYLEEGKSAIRREDFATAEKNLMHAKLFYPWNPLVYFYLGRSALGPGVPDQDPYYPQANYEEALRRYELAIKFGLEKKGRYLHTRALENIGFSQWNLKQYYKAVGTYRKSIELYPEVSFWPRYFVATNKFERENQPKEALDTLTPALDLPLPENEEKNIFRAHSLLSRLYLYFEKFEEAEKHAKLAIENAGAFDTSFEVRIAYAVLAQVYGARLNFSLAEKEIAMAEGSKETPGVYGCTLAQAYFLGKNYAKAMTAARNVPQIENKFYSLCLYTLAEAHKAARNPAESKKYFAEYLKFTDSLDDKNIFVMRRRALAKEALE